VAGLKGRERNEQVMLVLLLVAVASALAADFRSPLPWIFLVPCVVSFFRQIGRLPPWLANSLRYAAWTLVVAAAAMVRFFPTNQIFSPRSSTQLE
jgi:hypothetical protein